MVEKVLQSDQKAASGSISAIFQNIHIYFMFCIEDANMKYKKKYGLLFFKQLRSIL